MFTPSQADVRRFFCQVYQKMQASPSFSPAPERMAPIEILAAQWIEEHPEYHADLAQENEALARMYEVDAGRSNPFLHLSMHLSISEQCSIDQPPGVRRVVETLSRKHHSLHQAHHEVMEALGRMLWESQRSGRPPDGQAYIDALERGLSKD